MRLGPLPALLALACACGDNKATQTAVDASALDAAPPPIDAAAPPDAFGPTTLFDTGLCVDHACTQISPGVTAYAPRWTLWADGATKRRWFQLPAGAQIDTSDMDHWQFPVGTRFWKEFTAFTGSDGESGSAVRVETRFIERIGSGDTQDDWFYVAFQWDLTQDEAIAEPDGVPDADGTFHDIPSRADCRSCHENLVPTRILGFGALQLDAPGSDGDADLASLVAAGTLTQPPTAGSGGSGSPYFPFEATGSAQDALGYLHANCGHCHNATSPLQGTTPLQLRLTVGTVADTASTPTYTTAVGVTTATLVNGDSILVDPGQPDMSVLIARFEAVPGSSTHMPPLATKIEDGSGDATLRSWISGMGSGSD